MRRAMGINRYGNYRKSSLRVLRLPQSSNRKTTKLCPLRAPCVPRVLSVPRRPGLSASL